MPKYRDYGVPYDRYDYNTFTDINTTAEERRKLNIGDIYQNQAQCGTCEEIIRSKNRHDMVRCKCGAISVDGGSWYLKRSGNLKNYKELSTQYKDVQHED